MAMHSRSRAPRFSSHPTAVRAQSRQVGTSLVEERSLAEDATAQFLARRGFGPLHAERAVQAFRNIGAPPGSWVQELEHMAADDGALAQFLISIERSLVPTMAVPVVTPKPCDGHRCSIAVENAWARSAHPASTSRSGRGFGNDITNTSSTGSLGPEKCQSHIVQP